MIIIRSTGNLRLTVDESVTLYTLSRMHMGTSHTKKARPDPGELLVIN